MERFISHNSGLRVKRDWHIQWEGDKVYIVVDDGRLPSPIYLHISAARAKVLLDAVTRVLGRR